MLLDVDLEKWSYVATIATAVIAALAALSTLLIYSRQRNADRQSFAKGLVRELNLLALANPKFANPCLAKIDFSGRTLDGSRDEFTKYVRFVDFTLWTDEEVLAIMRDSRWRQFVSSTLQRHRNYLVSDTFGEFDSYFSQELSGMIREIRKDAGSKTHPGDSPSSMVE